MFRELMPLIQRRPLTLTVAAIDDKQIRVNIVPGKSEKDKAANKEIGHSHSKEVAPIPESAIAALATPLSLTGAPDEIDAQLAKTLTEFTALHVGLQNSFDTAADAIKKATKEIDERERIKKEHDKAKNKKPEPAKAEEKKQEPETLPSLFTAPTAQTAVSANDSTTAGGGGS
ncbi:MAG TPA: PRTRC system protein E [Candidatus Angelobacter sp.]|nr:PRTRC system protein E [Candidatus Angelobacter sp.]